MTEMIGDGTISIERTPNPRGIQLTTRDDKIHQVDMVIGAFGHNPPLMRNIKYPSEQISLEEPVSQRASVREYAFPSGVNLLSGEKMHVFGNPTPHIWFASIIPKDDYTSKTQVCK